MKRVHVSLAATLAVVIGTWLLSGFLTAAQQTTCAATAGDATARARRADAIRIARQINTAEARAFQSQRRYLPLSAFPEITLPADLSTQLVTTPSGYMFSIKDLQDACGFALFSDQGGVIFTAQPLR